MWALNYNQIRVTDPRLDLSHPVQFAVEQDLPISQLEPLLLARHDW